MRANRVHYAALDLAVSCLRTSPHQSTDGHDRYRDRMKVSSRRIVESARKTAVRLHDEVLFRKCEAAQKVLEEP